jgi:hypothetical protein
LGVWVESGISMCVCVVSKLKKLFYQQRQREYAVAGKNVQSVSPKLNYERISNSMRRKLKKPYYKGK